MMKWRIIEHVEGSGESWYYPQNKKWYNLFWNYLFNSLDCCYSDDKHRMCFCELEECKKYINDKILLAEQKRQREYNKSVIKKIVHKL